MSISSLIYTLRLEIVVFSYTCSCRNIHIYAGYIPTQGITDAVTNDQEDFFNNIYLSLYCKVRKGCSRFACERVLETEQKLPYFDPSLLWPSRCVFLVHLMFNRRPRGSLCWVICYILSATSQVPKLHRGSRGPHRPGVAFPTTSRLQLHPIFNSTGRNPIQLYNRSTPTRSLKSNV